MSQTRPATLESGTVPRNPPGPHSLSPLGSTPTIARDSRAFALDMWQRYGDIVRFRLFIWPGYSLFHPDHVKYVLQDNNRNYDKQFPLADPIKFLVGNGLFTSDGDSWLQQRRLMQPSFHHKHIAGFGTIITDATLTMLERWQSTGSQPLDIPMETMRLAQRIIGLTFFNLDLSAEVDTVYHAFTTLLPEMIKYIYFPFPPLWVPIPRNRRFQAGIETLDKVVYGIIAERRKRANDPDMDTQDLLSMLMAARDEETGEGMSDRQLRDEVLTLLLGGYESTSSALTWTWYLLSQHPDIEQRLHAELDTVLSGQLPTVDRLDGLPYTRMVIQEALRLYPPTFGTTRHTIADDEIGGYHVPANSIIFLTPYYTHRHPAFWEDPERFDPERFAPERSVGRPRFAYFPFGGGPRQCIGSAFAMMNIQLVLATVAQRYKLCLVPNHPVEPQVLFTLRPRYGLPMTLHARQKD